MAYNFPSNPTLNEVYSYNGRTFKWNGVQWTAMAAPTSTTAPVYVSFAPPQNPLVGALWFNTIDFSLNVRVQSLSGAYWESVGSPAPEPTLQTPVYVSVSQPANPKLGYLWFSPETKVIKVRVPTPSGAIWDEVVNAASTCSGLSQAIFSASAPLDPVNGLFWYNTVDDSLYKWTESLNGGYWVLANEVPCSERQPTIFISSSPPANPVPGDLWYDSDNSDFNIFYQDLDGGQWIVVIPTPQDNVFETGGTYTNPIYASYGIPDSPYAFVTAEWVEDRINQQGIPETIFTAKGSLITSTAASTPAELLLGTDGEFLKVDETTPTGVTWSNNVDCGAF